MNEWSFSSDREAKQKKLIHTALPLLPYLNAATLQEVLADVSSIVLYGMLVDELLAHNWPFLLKARDFSIL